MKEFVKKYAKGVHSQNGEEGIIEEALKRMDKSVGVAVEFGAPNQTYCSNIYFLKEKGWVCRYFSDEASEGVEQKFITPGNVNELPECNVLSIDIDGNDFEVWKAYNGRPEIVIIEINSSLNPDEEFFSPSQGSSFYTMNKLASEKGYFLLCHTGNCIYVDLKYKELFPEIYLIVTSNLFFNRSWLPKEDLGGVQFKLSDSNGVVYK